MADNGKKKHKAHGWPAGGGCNQRTQPPASTPSQDQRTQKRTRAQPSSATRRQLEDETARHQACMADAMELLEKRRNRKRKRSACANELDRMGSATIADHTNSGLLDVVTERICFFCSQERYVYNMWRGFSAEGAQHQMKQHIRSHKEPAPHLN